MAERRFNEKELAEILRRAGQRQFAGSEGESGTYSLADIQRLAGEVGIEPALVAAEASRLLERPEEPAGFWGAAPTLIREISVSGHLSEETWEEMVAELRALYGGVGKVTRTELSREWSGGEFLPAHLAATRRRNETRLRLSVQQSGALFVTWVMGFMITFTLTMVLLRQVAAVDFKILAALAIPLICLTAVNRFAARSEAKNRRRLDRAIQRIGQMASGGVEESGVLENLSTATEISVESASGTVDLSAPHS